MLIQADARSIPLRDGCVQCVITSPPYFGLRNYGIAQQIGMESTVTGYLAALLAVFQNVRQVLANDGVCWLNLGDSYAAQPVGTFNGGGFRDTSARTGGRDLSGVATSGVLDKIQASGCKPKDLLGIPWRVAFALQADGWYLRSDVIWHKPNPMPESVTDRPTKAHEYLFLLAKSERYYFDADAIAEPVSAAMLTEMEQGYQGLGLKDYDAAGVQNPSSVKARIIANARVKSAHMKDTPRNDGDRWRTVDGGVAPRGLGRNRRSVWTIPTQSYAGAHFATMPEALVEPCILAGSRPGDLILDPFIGSGTVGAVAERLGRRWVGTDLNPAYHQLAKKRTAQRGLRFQDQSA